MVGVDMVTGFPLTGLQAVSSTSRAISTANDDCKFGLKGIASFLSRADRPCCLFNDTIPSKCLQATLISKAGLFKSRRVHSPPYPKGKKERGAAGPGRQRHALSFPLLPPRAAVLA